MSPEKLNIATVSPSSHLPIALAGRGDYTRKLFATADSVGLRHGVRGHFVVIERGLRARLPQLTRACDFVIDAMHDQPESAGPQVDFVAQNRVARHAKDQERPTSALNPPRATARYGQGLSKSTQRAFQTQRAPRPADIVSFLTWRSLLG